jgi:hypothetical protein
MKRDFFVGVTTDSRTGRLMAVYFQFRRGKAAKVREFADGNAFANYNEKGELLGIELLGPCKVEVVDKIAKRDDLKKFIRSAAPSAMLVGAGSS